jgi:hypothetical protein
MKAPSCGASFRYGIGRAKCSDHCIAKNIVKKYLIFSFGEDKGRRHFPFILFDTFLLSTWIRERVTITLGCFHTEDI